MFREKTNPPSSFDSATFSLKEVNLIALYWTPIFNEHFSEIGKQLESSGISNCLAFQVLKA